MDKGPREWTTPRVVLARVLQGSSGAVTYPVQIGPRVNCQWGGRSRGDAAALVMRVCVCLQAMSLQSLGHEMWKRFFPGGVGGAVM